MSEVIEVIVGRIGRAHGIKGAVMVEVRTDEPARRFAPGVKLRGSQGRDLEIATVNWHQGRLQLTFVGHADRNAAEALRGTELRMDVPADETPSQDDEYFVRQLVGLRVLDAAGVERGKVSDVLHMPAQEVLSITTPEGTRLVPFVSQLVPHVDVEAGQLQLADVAGLLEDLE